jgi:hypothetical protein
MTAQQIINVLNQLPTSYPSDKTAKRAEMKIKSTAEFIAPILAERGLQISKGSSSPSQSRSYARIYLERIGNTSHDSRHRAYAENVLATWEFTTMSGGYSRGVTCKAICEMCDALVSRFV